MCLLTLGNNLFLAHCLSQGSQPVGRDPFTGVMYQISYISDILEFITRKIIVMK